MSTTTPPGWYPDPRHSGTGPAQERWWDGAAWTEHIRTAAQPAQPATPASAEPVHEQPTMVGPAPWQSPAPGPPPPGPVPPPPGGSRSRGPLVAGIVGALVLVAGLVVGGALMLRDDGDDSGGNRAEERTMVTPRPSESAEDDARPTATPPSFPERVADPRTGVSLPVPQGWEKRDLGMGSAVVTGPYACPADPSLGCLRAGVVVTPVPGLSAHGPRQTAEEDISRNAGDNYPAEAYGGITSHTEVFSKPVTVAGQQGHRVRWKLTNEQKPDAYVESLVFPSPRDRNILVRVRISFDIHDDAPTEAEIEQFVAGIQPLPDKRDPNEV